MKLINLNGAGIVGKVTDTNGASVFMLREVLESNGRFYAQTSSYIYAFDLVEGRLESQSAATEFETEESDLELGDGIIPMIHTTVNNLTTIDSVIDQVNVFSLNMPTLTLIKKLEGGVEL